MAKKLLKLPSDLTFNVIYDRTDSRGLTTMAYECEQHPEIEVRIHTDLEGEQFRQVFLLDDEDIINYQTVKRAWRALAEREPPRVKRKNIKKSIADGNRKTHGKKIDVPKAKRRSGNLKRR